MSIEDRVGKAERRVKSVEQAVQLLSELVISHDESFVKFLKNDEELNAKISALIDAQIRGEDKLQNINFALEKLTRLVETAHTRIDRLEN